MLRYVAIGAIAGFLIAYFLLSSPPPPPAETAAVPKPLEIPQVAPGMQPVPINLPRGLGRMPNPPLQQMGVGTDGG